MQTDRTRTGESVPTEAAIAIGDAARLGQELGRRGFCGTEARPENSLLHQEVLYHARDEVVVAAMRRGNHGLEGVAVQVLRRTDIAAETPEIKAPAAPPNDFPGGLPARQWARAVTEMYHRGVWRPHRYPIETVSAALDRLEAVGSFEPTGDERGSGRSAIGE
jgi:hypothetical protein